MKKSWNGLLALGRSVAGLEGRPREFRVVEEGFPPRLPGERPMGALVGQPVNSASETPQTASGGGVAAVAQSQLTGVRTPANRFEGVTPTVARTPRWRWFGWFRRRPVGSTRPEQIELRLEDVRPVRSSLAAEDFVVMKHVMPKPARRGPNPFLEPPRAAPKAVPAAEPKRSSRLSRWFRNRETTPLE